MVNCLSDYLLNGLSAYLVVCSCHCPKTLTISNRIVFYPKLSCEVPTTWVKELRFHPLMFRWMGASLFHASLTEASMTDSPLMTVIVVVAMMIMMMLITCLADYLLNGLPAYLVVCSCDCRFLWFCWSAYLILHLYLVIFHIWLYAYQMICLSAYLFVCLCDWRLIWSSVCLLIWFFYLYQFAYVIMRRSAHLIIWLSDYLIIWSSQYLMICLFADLTVWLSDGCLMLDAWWSMTDGDWCLMMMTIHDLWWFMICDGWCLMINDWWFMSSARWLITKL